MADDTKNTNEQYIDAITDTSTSMESLFQAMAALGRNTSELTKMLGSTEIDFSAASTQIRRVLKQVTAFTKAGGTNDQAVRQKGGFDALSSMNSLDVKGIQKTMQAMLEQAAKTASSELDQKAIQKAMAGLNTEMTGLFNDLNTSIKFFRKMAKEQLKTTQLFTTGSGTSSYKSQASSVAQAQVRNKPSREAINAVYKQGSARNLYYPAATGGKNHQGGADVFTHSVDTSKAITEVVKSKDAVERVYQQLQKEGYSGIRGTDAGGRPLSGGKLITREQVAAALAKDSVVENAKGAALIHDLGKSAGSSPTEGKGYAANHADLVSDMTKVTGLSQAAQSALSKFVSIAETHHSTLGDTDLRSVEDIVSAALLKIGDATSATNANFSRDARGRVTGNIEGFTQTAVSSRATLADNPNYQRLKNSAWAEEDPADYIFKQMTDVMSGNKKRSDAALKELGLMNLGNLGEIALKADKNTAAMINFAAGAEGKSVINPEEIRNAYEGMAGTDKGYLGADGKTLSPAQLGASLSKTDPALVIAQMLKPGLFKGLEAQLRTSPGRGETIDVDQLDRARSASGSQPNTQAADRMAYMIKAIDSAAAPVGDGADLETAAAHVRNFISGVQTAATNIDQDSSVRNAVQGATHYRNEAGAVQPAKEDITGSYLQNLVRAVTASVSGREFKGNAEANSDLLDRAISRALSSAEYSGSAEDVNRLAHAQRANVAQQAQLASIRAGQPEADVAKTLAEASKIEQSIQESIAKASLMSARAEKTTVETDTAVKTQASVVQLAKEKANQAILKTTEEQLALQTKQAAQDDQILQVKTKTETMMSKLTEEQRAQVQLSAKAALEATPKSQLKTFELAWNELAQYNSQVSAVQQDLLMVQQAQNQAAINSKARADQFNTLKTNLIQNPGDLKSGEIADRLKAEKDLMTLQSRADQDLVSSAKQSLASSEKELEQVRQRLTLEAEIVRIKAQSDLSVSAAQSKALSVQQQEVQLEISQATKQDEIDQTRIKTLQMEEDLKSKILANESQIYQMSKKNTDSAAQQVAYAKNLASKSLARNLAYASGVGANNRAAGWNPSGMSIFSQGQGINTGALKYATRNGVYGVLGGLAGVASGTQLLRESVSNMKDYETAVVNLKRVWQDVPQNQVLLALSDMNDMALQYGQTLQNVGKIQEEWAKVGVETASDLSELSKTSILALNTSDMTEASDVVAYLNSARVQMGLTTDDINHLLDSWNKLADVTTADTSDFAEAYQKAAGYANQIGLSATELDSVIATMIENTGRSGAEVGTALRQIFANVYSALNIKKLQSLGVEVYANKITGAFLPFDQLLGNISEKYQELKKESGGAMSADMVNLLNVLGATRRRNYAIALLEGYDKSGLNGSENPDAYTNVSQNSSGYSEKKFEMTMDTLTYKSTLLQAAFTKAANAFGEYGTMDVIKGIVDVLSEVLEAYSELDPKTRNWYTSLGLVAVTMKAIGAVSKATFGGSITKAIVQNILNTGKLNAALQKTAQDATLMNKSDFKASYAKGNIDVGLGTGAVNLDEIMANLQKNESLMEGLKKIADETGTSFESLQEKTFLSVRASYGDLVAQEKLAKITLDEVSASVKAQTTAREGAAAAAKAQATAEETVNAAEATGTKTSTGSAAANNVQAASENNVAGATGKAAAGTAGANAADVVSGKTSAEAAASNLAQAAAENAVAKAAVAASIKTAFLTMGLNLLIGVLASAVMSHLANADAQKEELDDQVVLVQKQQDEIDTLEKLNKKYKAAKDVLDNSTSSSEDQAAAKEQLISLNQEIADAAPALSGYYQNEFDALVKNNSELEEYLNYKKQLAENSNQVLQTTGGWQVEQYDQAIKDDQSKLDLGTSAAGKLVDLANAFTSGKYTSKSVYTEFGRDNIIVDSKGHSVGGNSLLKQYGLTDEEIKYLNDQGLSASDILNKINTLESINQAITKLTNSNQTLADNIDKNVEAKTQLEGSLTESNRKTAMQARTDYNIGFDADKFTGDIDTATSQTQQISSELEDYQSDISDLQTALNNLESAKPDSQKFKAALNMLDGAGFSAIDIDVNGQSKTIGSLTPDEIKSNLNQIIQKIEDQANQSTADYIDRINKTISDNQAKIDAANTAIANLGKDGAKSPEALQKDLESLAPKASSFESDATGRASYNKAYSDYLADPEKYAQAHGYSAADLQSIQAIVGYLNQYKTQTETLQKSISQAEQAISDAQSSLLNVDDTATFERVDYSSLAQEYAEKLAKADNEGDVKAELEKIKVYFGDIKLDIDGTTQTLSEVDLDTAMKHLDQVILGMNLKSTQDYSQIYGPVGQIGSITADMVDSLKEAAEKNGASESDLKKAVDTINGTSKGITDILSQLSMPDSKLKNATEIQQWLSQYQEGAAQIDSFSKQAAQALNDLTDSLKNGWDPLAPEVTQGADLLKNLFGDLEVLNVKLGDQNSKWMADNADAITKAIDAQIDTKNQAAQQYAADQIKIVKDAIAHLKTIISDTGGMLGNMADALIPILGSKAKEAITSYTDKLLGQLTDLETMWTNVEAGIKSAGKNKNPTGDYRKSLAKNTGSGSTNKWKALDKQLKGIKQTIDTLTSSIDTLDTVWANDTTNVKYLSQAYAKQGALINTYASAIQEVTNLRKKTKGDADKYEELTETINEYTKALITAYQKQSELAASKYTDFIDETTNKTEYAQSSLELYISTLRPYEKTLGTLGANQKSWALQLVSIGTQYKATADEINRLKGEVTKLSSVAKTAGNSFKGMYATGQIDHLKDQILNLRGTLVKLGGDAETIRQNMIEAFSSAIVDEYNDRLDEELTRIKKIRKENQKSHDERLKQLNDLLENLDDTRQAEQDKRDLEDLEAQISVVKIRIQRLSSDSSQYGQKLLKDAYKTLGDLQKQYNDKLQSVNDQKYKDSIQDQIDQENDSYDKLTESLDNEEDAWNEHYQTLIDNAKSFAEGLVDTYQTNQKDVISYLQSEGLLDAYTKAAKMASAAYNSGITLYNPDTGLTQNADGTYSSDPTDVYGNNGTSRDTNYDGSTDYQSLINDAIAKAKKSTTWTDAHQYWLQAQRYELLRNQKIASPDYTGTKIPSYNYQGDFKDWWTANYSTIQKNRSSVSTTGTGTTNSTKSYTVRSGDSLSLIAQSQLGSSSRWSEIAKLNGIKSPYTIYSGQKLKIPTAHTGGVIGPVSPELSSLFGLKPKETLVKALEGEYLTPKTQMDQVLPNIRDSIVELLQKSDLTVNPDDFKNISTVQPKLASEGSIGSIDQSTSVDKAINIEKAVFSKELDVQTLEGVAGRYLKDTLARKGFSTSH